MHHGREVHSDGEPSVMRRSSQRSRVHKEVQESDQSLRSGESPLGRRIVG
jgi:hypothetical protein